MLKSRRSLIGNSKMKNKNSSSKSELNSTNSMNSSTSKPITAVKKKEKSMMIKKKKETLRIKPERESYLISELSADFFNFSKIFILKTLLF